jgi:hypothetical protein
MKETYWQIIIHEIRQASKELDGYPWSHRKIGELAGTNRNTAWKLSLPADHFDHLSEPKFSVGMALLEVHAKLMERISEKTKS